MLSALELHEMDVFLNKTAHKLTVQIGGQETEKRWNEKVEEFVLWALSELIRNLLKALACGCFLLCILGCTVALDLGGVGMVRVGQQGSPGMYTV
jgi:hypothetical protein